MQENYLAKNASTTNFLKRRSYRFKESKESLVCQITYATDNLVAGFLTWKAWEDLNKQKTFQKSKGLVKLTLLKSNLRHWLQL